MSVNGTMLQTFDQFNSTLQYGLVYGVAPNGASFIAATPDAVNDGMKLIAGIAIGVLGIVGFMIYGLINKKQQPITILNVPVSARPVKHRQVQSRQVVKKRMTNFDKYVENVKAFYKTNQISIVGSTLSLCVIVLGNIIKK